MKLREFFEYRKECPICQTLLVTSFHSQRKQKTRYEDGRYLALFDLNALKKGSPNYKVGYSFGLEDNSWYVEFYTKDELRFHNETQLHLMDKFKALDANLKNYKIYKHCTKCKRYNYSTEYFKLDYKNASIGDISVNTEFIVMLQPIADDTYKVYKMLNYYNTNKTWLNYGKYSTDNMVIDDRTMELPNMIQTGMIPFTSHDETMQRVSKLITFS